MQPFLIATSKLQFLLVLICLINPIFIEPIFAQSTNAVERGLAVVDQWCRLCHVRLEAETSSDTAPPFKQIVQRPGRDRAYLRAFMDEDHFPMTTFRLFDSEKDDVVEYLMDLKHK
mgnify:CR=1 FL=1